MKKSDETYVLLIGSESTGKSTQTISLLFVDPDAHVCFSGD